MARYINLPRCKVKNEIVNEQTQYIQSVSKTITAVRTSGPAALITELAELPNGTCFHIVERCKRSYFDMFEIIMNMPKVHMHFGDIRQISPALAARCQTPVFWLDADTVGTYGSEAPLAGLSKPQRELNQILNTCLSDNIFLTYTFCRRNEDASWLRDRFLYEYIPQKAEINQITVLTKQIQFYRGTRGSNMLTAFYHLRRDNAATG